MNTKYHTAFKGALILTGLLMTACASAPVKPVDQHIAYRDQANLNHLQSLHGQGYQDAPVKTASLWSNTPNSLFGDRRARGPGDILTVQIDINDEADMRNTLSTERDSEQSFSLGSLFGLDQLLSDVLPDGANLDPGIDIRRGSNVDGSGQLRRQEEITLTLAAQVVSVTPNGDLAIAGYQSVQVDGETRTLAVSGVIRREDISRQNVITLDKIANARVIYGGAGVVNRQTDDRWGHKVIDTVVPF